MQVAWREKRRKLLLFIQSQIHATGCMDVMQELDDAESRLAHGPGSAVAACAMHASAAVGALSELRARFASSAALFLHLLLACGSADGSPLHPQHIARIQSLLKRFYGHMAAAGAVLLLRDSWASGRALPGANPSLESLQITDSAPTVRSGPPGTSLLQLLARPSIEETLKTLSGGALVALDLIRHGARATLPRFSRLAAAQEAAVASAGTGPGAAFLRGLCALAAVDVSESSNSDPDTVSAVALPLLCGAVDQALLLWRTASDGAPPQVQAFESIIHTLYQGMCSAAAPGLSDSLDLFEVWKSNHEILWDHSHRCTSHNFTLLQPYARQPLVW